jgi:hypothetical protein
MAEDDRNPETIIGRDAHAKSASEGDRLIDQLSQTTTEDAGGNVSGTGADDACEDLDIVFEFETSEDTRH